MATKNASKSITLAVCPELNLRDHPECISTQMNSTNNAVVLTLRFLVGSPEVRSAEKGNTMIEWNDSGVLMLDGATVEINGVDHKITVRKAMWKDGRRIGSDAIVVRPVKEKKAETKVEIGF